MLLQDPKSLPEELHGAVMAIGNFDGVHRGHAALLSHAKEIASKQGRPFLILTFEPHPKQYFQPEKTPFRIAPWPLKQRKLEEFSPDGIICLRFDETLTRQGATEFVTQTLKERLKVHEVVVGSDFRFGYKRQGDCETIREGGVNVHPFDLSVCDEEGHIISSSRIRECLRNGDLEKAERLLGWPWEVCGAVVKGDQRGRELGYPTANVPLETTLWPSYGIYACLVRIDGLRGFEGKWLKAATNIGIRPMFEKPEPLLEAHILDFDADLYGKELRVRPIRKIRDEAKFDSLDALIAQMEKDCAETRLILDGYLRKTA